jgi:hypothetical protein
VEKEHGIFFSTTQATEDEDGLSMRMSGQKTAEIFSATQADEDGLSMKLREILVAAAGPLGGLEMYDLLSS